MPKLLDDNDIIMYSTLNEDDSVVTERFMGTLDAKIYKRIAANK